MTELEELAEKAIEAKRKYIADAIGGNEVGLWSSLKIAEGCFYAKMTPGAYLTLIQEKRKMEGRIAKLEKALRPFAERLKELNDNGEYLPLERAFIKAQIYIPHLRAAARALTSGDTP